MPLFGVDLRAFRSRRRSIPASRSNLCETLARIIAGVASATPAYTREPMAISPLRLSSDLAGGSNGSLVISYRIGARPVCGYSRAFDTTLGILWLSLVRMGAVDRRPRGGLADSAGWST